MYVTKMDTAINVETWICGRIYFKCCFGFPMSNWWKTKEKISVNLISVVQMYYTNFELEFAVKHFICSFGFPMGNRIKIDKKNTNF